MEEIRVTFENDGMQCEVSTTAEHYTQAVYTLIEQGFEHLGELDRFCLLVALYKLSNYIQWRKTMEIRRFILDLQPDGSVKWAEVSERNIEANEEVKRLRSCVVDTKNSETEESAKIYWAGFIDGIDETMKFY